jgi:hypothetical protein
MFTTRWVARCKARRASMAGARVRDLAVNPKVTLHFHGDARGGDVVVFSGVARVDRSAPGVDANPAWPEKYAGQIEQFGMMASRAARFSVPIRMRLTRLDGG